MLKSVFVAIAIGAGILVAAQSLGRVAYVADYYREGAKFTLAMAIVVIAAYQIGYKNYLAFTLMIAALYGIGHILYDVIIAYLYASAFKYTFSQHLLQASLSATCLLGALFLLWSSKKSKREKQK